MRKDREKAAQPSRGVIYARVSTKKQEKKGLSIPGQIERCRKKAVELGIEIAATFTEAESASEEAEKRPAFQDAVAFALEKSNGINAFVIYDSSRFARRREDAATYKAVLRRKGVQIVYVEHSIDGDNDDDLFIEGLYELLDERYSRILGKLALRGMADNARKGYFNGGQAPIGYRWKKIRVGEATKLTLEIDPATSTIIRKIFDLVLQGQGCIEIARRINADETFPASKCRWTSTMVSRVLHNPRYKGWSSFKNGEEQITVENTHPPIIPPAEWDRAQGLLAARVPFQRGRVNPRRTVYFSGLLFCGKCGHAMTASVSGGRGNHTYHYYECSAGRKGGGCEGLRLPAEKFDRAMLKFLGERLFGEQAIGRMFSSVKAFIEEHNRGVLEQRMSLKEQMAQAEMRIARLYEVLETHAEFDPDDLAPRVAQLKKSKEALANQLANLAEIPEPSDSPATRKRLSDVLKDAIATARPEEIVSFLGRFDVRITVDGENVEVNANPALVLAASGSEGAGCIVFEKWRAERTRPMHHYSRRNPTGPRFSMRSKTALIYIGE